MSSATSRLRLYFHYIKVDFKKIRSRSTPTTYTHTCWFLWFTGTLHRRNGFYTVETVCAIALHLNFALTGDGAFRLSPQKTHSVWFISVVNYGDTENVLINHLLLVIPMSYPCHYTNLCPHKPHKHAQTYIHTYIHTYSAQPPRTLHLQSEERAKKVTLDTSHPAHSLVELLPSGRRYRALSTETVPPPPQAISHLNNT